MARRGERSPIPPNPRKARRPESRRDAMPVTSTGARSSAPDPSPAAVLGERLRRAALGLTAALITARAFTTSEPDLEFGAGSGLYWVLALMVVAGLALAAALVGGTLRFRRSWTDAAVSILMLLVAFSSLHALDRRPAINLAWDWVAWGITYLLIRNLPRTRGETQTVAAALVATAFALSVYGLYQAGVELPRIQNDYRRNPVEFLLRHPEIGVTPGTSQHFQFEQRLLQSSEITSTFALANSFAGYLVGPLVLVLAVGFENLARREPAGSRFRALAMAAPLVVVLLVVLLLTKSRSAYIGLLVGAGIVAWRARRNVPTRLLGWSAAACGAVITLLVAFAIANKKLDIQVLTQSPLSMRYRWEYWQGTWDVITGGASNGLSALRGALTRWGVGPGNFRHAYLRYKLPWASEEIQDPHNLFLEVWATAGFGAFLALLAALVLGLRELLSAPAPHPAGSDDSAIPPTKLDSPPSGRHARMDDDDAPPRRTLWLAASAGAGWIVVVAIGMMNLFANDMFPRWLILGASWVAGILLIWPLWERLPVPAGSLAAAVAAVVVNLLAAGGIGIPTVALGLWTMLALGLNLREDRACGRLHAAESRVPPFVLSTVWAAVLGSFLGAVLPYWNAEAALSVAEDAMNRRPPDFDLAERAFERAIVQDRYYARPWLRYADFAEFAWEWRGHRPSDERWKKVPELLERAVSLPRNPNAWALHLRRADAIRRLLQRLGSEIEPTEEVTYNGEIIKESRKAMLLYPNNARLHARLAEANLAISLKPVAVEEAREALRLDDLMPHRDRKLFADQRQRLKDLIAQSESADKP